jgi:hypothetical protein
MSDLLRVAYADPPYPGQAHKHYHADPSGIVAAEVDHAALITRLCDEYPDGWALSTSSVALRDLLPRCPPDVRVAAWVKPFAVFKPNVNPAYAWEPVIWRGGRVKRSRTEPTVRDWLAANITLETGTHGAKPDAFGYWLFQLLGLRPGDIFDDLYPGSRRVSRAWQRWQRHLWSA